MLKRNNLLAVLLLCFLLFLCSSPIIGADDSYFTPKVALPSIIPSKLENSTIHQNYTFWLVSPEILKYQDYFENFNNSPFSEKLRARYVSDFTINATTTNSIYYGAKKSMRNTLISPNLTKEENYQKTIPRIIDDPNQDDFYNQLIAQFRAIKAQNRLENDEYLELISTFVQSIPYKTEIIPPKFPIETFFDGRGDCDDKSLLLAGLLEREGYDICLFVFDSGPVFSKYPHMLVGIRSNGLTYNNSGYSLIETTQRKYIGQTVTDYKNADSLVIKIGNGKKMYTSAHQVEYIENFETILSRKVNYLANKKDKTPSEIEENKKLTTTYAVITSGMIPRESAYYWSIKEIAPYLFTYTQPTNILGGDARLQIRE